MKHKFILIFIVLFLTSFASSSFELGNPAKNITTFYYSGDNLTGWINISFNEENLNSIFKTSEEQSISLIDLLIKNNLYERCDISNCEIDYSMVANS
ncbi:hypothetical protein ACFLZF_00260, partial [Nanoarchaeota archaeon]